MGYSRLMGGPCGLELNRSVAEFSTTESMTYWIL